MTVPSVERLLVRLPNWVGDIMMALPAVQALRAALPDARIVGMARPAHVELATRIRGLNDVLAAAPRTGGGRFRASWVAFTGLRRARFDAAVVMAPSFEAALTIWLAGIPIRVGHETDHRSALLNRVVGVRETHRADGFLDLVREFGIEEQAEPAALELSELDRRFADEFFNGVGVDREARPIFVNPAAAKRPRAWSSDRFRELSDAVASAHPDVPVIVHDHPPFEAPEGWPISQQIHGLSGANLSLVELAAVIEKCCLYVGNDSGPMHLAAALGVPTVGIYGSSSPQRTSPRGANGAAHIVVSAGFECSPCRERFFDECPSPPSAEQRPPCLEAIDVETVAASVDRILNLSRFV